MHGDFAQHLIERGACFALVDRIDPNQHGVNCQQLFADCIREALVIDGRMRRDTQRVESLEHANEAAVLWRRISSGNSIASRDDRYGST